MTDIKGRVFTRSESLSLFKDTIKKMYKECERMIEDGWKNPLNASDIDIILPFLDYTNIGTWYDTSMEKVLSKDELKKTIYLCILSDNITMIYRFYTDILEIIYENTDEERCETYNNISECTDSFFVELFKNTIIMIYSAMDQFHMLKCTDGLSMPKIMNAMKEEEKMGIDLRFNEDNRDEENEEDVLITVNDIRDKCNELYNIVEAKDFANDGFYKIITIRSNYYNIDLKYKNDKINGIICTCKDEYYNLSLSISFEKGNTYDMKYFIDKIVPDFNKDIIVIENHFEITHLYSAIVNEITNHSSKVQPINVFISQPMNGLSIEEIKSTRNKLVNKFKRYLKKKDPKTNYIVKVLDNLQENAPEYYAHLDYISNDIRIINWADIIVFANGYNNARGCLIEDMVWYNYKTNDKDMKGEDRDRYEFIRKHIGLNKLTESMIDDYLNKKD